jgi:hypothetical protein
LLATGATKTSDILLGNVELEEVILVLVVIIEDVVVYDGADVVAADVEVLEKKLVELGDEVVIVVANGLKVGTALVVRFVSGDVPRYAYP